MGTFVSYFFSGFIMGRVPFPLSPSFRVMLQVGSRPHWLSTCAPLQPVPQLGFACHRRLRPTTLASRQLCRPKGCACRGAWICPAWT